MKRLHFFLPVIAMTFALCCTSCSKDDEDDEIIPVNIDGWESARYSSCKIDGLNYFEVPVEGGTLGFRCSKDDAVKLTNHSFYTDVYKWNLTIDDETRDSAYYKNDWCEATVKGDSLILKFKSNESDYRRKANIGVRYGGEDVCFRFVQKTKNSIDSKLVGDWVADPEADLGMFSECGRYRYSFHDDGTCMVKFDSYVRPTPGFTSFEKKLSWSSGNVKFPDGGWGSQNYDCTYRLNGDKLILKILDFDSEIPFVRLSSSNESAAPMYELSVTPTKSPDVYVLPGEKYFLNCKKVVGGNDYVVDSVCVRRFTCYPHGNVVRDTLYIAQNTRQDLAFSTELEMPANATSVDFIFHAYFKFWDRNSKGEVIAREYSNYNVIYVYNKKLYLEKNQ